MRHKQARRTAQQMFPLVEAYLAGEQTQIQFCQDHDLSVAVLCYWLRKYGASGVPAVADTANSTTWVELTPAAVSGEAALELLYPNGVRLRVPAGVEVAYVHQLIHYTAG